MTDAERLLWTRLRSKRFLGNKFRRQHPMGFFIVDFVCLEKKLIIEVDGGQHQQQIDYDQRREEWLKEKGFRILRFWNHEVLRGLDVVCERIYQILCPHLSPPPLCGGGNRNESVRGSEWHKEFK